MTRSAIFWMIMILWLLAMLGAVLAPAGYREHVVFAREVVLILLLGLLGWQVYGPAIKGG